MYKIDKKQNNITKLEVRMFSDLKIKEREHLQEWIAKNPEVLGEELLIIQKEFSGFNDTNERLDLLAMDKSGNLVIIENKLDDTGRDVVWQALKYTSYCSTLTTAQIIKIYQEYLNIYSSNEDAKESLLDFLEWADEADFLLNRNDQRIIFVANNYRKEVTSTVLWLLNHDVQIQCFRATPYSMGEDLFLQIEQIIPLPETTQYMIDAKEKEKDEKGKSKTVTETEQKLIEFWSFLKQDLKAHNNNFLEKIAPKKSFSIGTWHGRARFGYCLGKHAIRVELYIPNDTDKKLFDALFKFKDEIDAKSSRKIIWQRLDNKLASRIKCEYPADEFAAISDWDDEVQKQKQIDWFREAMTELYKVIYPYWEKVQKQVK